MGRHCPTRTVLGIVKQPGAFAEYLTLPGANLHVVPGRVPPEHAVFTEPLAAACEILGQVARSRRANPWRCWVTGAGAAGWRRWLRSEPCAVRLYGRHKEKMRDDRSRHGRGGVPGNCRRGSVRPCGGSDRPANGLATPSP